MKFLLLLFFISKISSDTYSDKDAEKCFDINPSIPSENSIKDYLINILKSDISRCFKLKSEINFTSESLKRIQELPKNTSVIKIDYEKNFFRISVLSMNKTIKIYGVFNLIKKIPVITKKIDNRITEEHIKFVDYAIDYRTNINDIVQSKSELIGKSLSVYEINQPILRKNVQTPSDIKKNSIVKIKAICKNMIIEVPGRALNDSAFGDVVDIENISSKKIIKCIANPDGSVSPISI